MKRKVKTRVLSLMVALSTMIVSLTGSIPVMAAESTVDSTIAETVENMEEAQALRSKLDSLIGESNETRAAYKTDYWGQVTFTNTNTGGWHTIYGHKARMCIAFKPVDGNTALSASLSTGFWGWTLHFNPNAVDSDGYNMYVGPWKDITYMGAYRMYYEIFTTGNGGVLDGRRASFHVWVDYQ